MAAGLVILSLGSDSDLSEAERLLVAFFGEEGFATPAETIGKNLHRMAGLDICTIFLAAVASRAVGVATVSLDFGIEFGWSAEVGDLYVLPAWRGRGVARALIDAAIAWSRGRGATSLRVTITPHGADANLVAFYERLGFSDDGRRLMAADLLPLDQATLTPPHCR